MSVYRDRTMHIVGEAIRLAAERTQQRAVELKEADPHSSAEHYRASELLFKQARAAISTAKRREHERLTKRTRETPDSAPPPTSAVQKLREDDTRMLDWIRNVS